MKGKADSSPNVYALVAYIPGPLGDFLNGLRAELVPSCSLLSHLTLLPPRLLNGPEEILVRQLEARIPKIPAFEVGLGYVEIFPLTNVVFLSVVGGLGTVENIHDELNRDALAYDEPFEFHPHVTLAQEFPPEAVMPTYELAQKRWKQFQGPRAFPIERLTFVRNVDGNRWQTVSEHSLAGVSLLRKA